LPYSNCISDVKIKKFIEKEVYDYIFASNISYRQVYCIDYYKQKYIIDECGCQASWFRRINKRSPLCSSNSTCFNRKGFQYVENASLIEEDFKKCPLECNTILNDISTSFIEYPAPGYLKDLKRHPIVRSKFNDQMNNVSDKQIKLSVTSFALYYQDFKYSVLSEVPLFSVISLVSNIGGTLGLFLGMSLLSSLEVFELFIEVLFHITNRRLAKNIIIAPLPQ
jgi:hypothetical protein